MTNLTILKTAIRTFDNLYSLNDLHLASGGEDKHRPTFFIRLDTTKDLIKEIESENSDVQICTSTKSLRTGANKGTWACEELALAYATWISPKFHLVVLRAFIAMHKGEVKNQQLALPEPEKTYDTNTTAKEIHELVWLLFSHEQMRSLLEHLYKPLEAIGSRYSGAIYGNYTEYKRHYDKCLPILKRFVEKIKADNPKAWEGLQYRLTAK